MQTVEVDQVQQRFPELLESAERGETVLIMRGDIRIGQLGPVLEQPLPASRRLGLLQGKGTVPLNWKDLSREEIEEEFGV